MFQYRVKIPRGKKTFLWGGEKINTGSPRQLKIPVLMHIRVDDLGEPVTVHYKAFPPATADTYGELQPGEAYTVSLDGLTAVFAQCVDKDTYVDCYMQCPAIQV